MRIDLTQQAPNLTSLWKKGGGRRPEGSKQNLRKALFKLYAARPIPQSQPRGRSAVTAPFHKGSLDADESQYVQYKIYLPLPRLSSLGRVLPRSWHFHPVFSCILAFLFKQFQPLFIRKIFFITKFKKAKQTTWFFCSIVLICAIGIWTFCEYPEKYFYV